MSELGCKATHHHRRSSSTGSHFLSISGHHRDHDHLIHQHHHDPHGGSLECLSNDNTDRYERGGNLRISELKGTLSKWTNFIHGWQDRYVNLNDGILAYYKSRAETDFGCRGAISVDKANVKTYIFDPLRFDVSVADCVWYLRAPSSEERQKWTDGIERSKKLYPTPDLLSLAPPHFLADSSSLRRQGSALSVQSSGSNRVVSARTLTENLVEMETFKDIICRQIDTLQGYFDACANVSGVVVISGDTEKQEQQQHLIDFKEESITFKAATDGMLATLSNCINELSERHEELLGWRKHLKKMEQSEPCSDHTKVMMMAGSEFDEGSLSQIGEEEFYDAVENALDKLEEEQGYKDKLKLMSDKHLLTSISQATQHPLWSTVDRVTNEQLLYARMEVGEGVWELFAQDGDMRMYKREEEVNGLAIDPLKALHQVRGVTAKEMCHYFFAPEYRTEWEATLEEATVLEKLADDTLIYLQLHKRVWPVAQRDALFWSHMRRVNDLPSTESSWMVCNQSTKHPNAPENQGGCYRVGLTICFVCDSFIEAPNKEAASRDDIITKITYCSQVDPGGWVPATVLRTIYKREYPRFLKRFTQYVIDKAKGQPVMW